MKAISIVTCGFIFLLGCAAMDKSDCHMAKLVSEGDLKELTTALQGVEKKQIMCEGKNVFSVAAASIGGYESANALLSAGISPIASDESGSTLLHAAAMWADLKMVRLLVDNGVDSNSVDGDGATPLDLAKVRNDPDGLQIVEYLTKLKSGR
jgi:ankyrin repeat protein